MLRNHLFTNLVRINPLSTEFRHFRTTGNADKLHKTANNLEANLTRRPFTLGAR